MIPSLFLLCSQIGVCRGDYDRTVVGGGVLDAPLVFVYLAGCRGRHPLRTHFIPSMQSPRQTQICVTKNRAVFSPIFKCKYKLRIYSSVDLEQVKCVDYLVCIHIAYDFGISVKSEIIINQNRFCGCIVRKRYCSVAIHITADNIL